MKNIVSIVNFIRAVEPREGRNINLPEAVCEQLNLLKFHNLRGTFLLQYDALIDKQYINLMKTHGNICEVGIWFEIVQPLVEAIGEKWRGRYPWDWYNDVGFLIGYEPEQRKKLIDEAMRVFYDIFERYPDSVGAWHIDAVSMAYLTEKYHVKACCICRDQVGMDGYTLQGGYYNQAYYPSRNNMFCPANSQENQITMPVFRMLGSDAIYAYDSKAIDYGFTKVPTLEPVGLGEEKYWCDWFFNETFSGNGLSMQFTQSGQENSFGWSKMENGITYQFAQIKELMLQNKVEVMTLGESGKWYLSQFKTTPPGTLTALSDWRNTGYKSIWYYSRYYRTNLFWDNGQIRIRDLYLFDDNYKEKYLHESCKTRACEFRNLPIMDGVLYTNPDDKMAAGIYLTNAGEIIQWDSLEYTEKDGCAQISLKSKKHKAVICLDETKIKITSDIEELQLQAIYDTEMVFGKKKTLDARFANHNNQSTTITYITEASIQKRQVTFVFDGHKYKMSAEIGYFDGNTLYSELGTLSLTFI